MRDAGDQVADDPHPPFGGTTRLAHDAAAPRNRWDVTFLSSIHRLKTGPRGLSPESCLENARQGVPPCVACNAGETPRGARCEQTKHAVGSPSRRGRRWATEKEDTMR